MMILMVMMMSGWLQKWNPFEKCGREADERAVRSNSCCWLKSQSLLGKYKLFDFLAFQIIMTLMDMNIIIISQNLVGKCKLLDFIQITMILMNIEQELFSLWCITTSPEPIFFDFHFKLKIRFFKEIGQIFFELTILNVKWFAWCEASHLHLGHSLWRYACNIEFTLFAN